MARQKPLGLAIVPEWLAAWDESNIFSDASVRHLQFLITDPFCLVVVTLGIGREPRSLVFRRVKYTLPAVPPKPNIQDMSRRSSLDVAAAPLHGQGSLAARTGGTD
jgi:hypothetical protein